MRSQRPANVKSCNTEGGRRARFARSLAQQGERLQLMAQIEVLQRLVEQHERRILRPQLGEPRALALAAR
jgi:hypothetical protein